MKTTFLVIVLLGAAWAFPKGPEEPQFKRVYVDPLKTIDDLLVPRITNGHEAVPHSIPYQAYLIFTGSDGRWLCGGSLISRNYVVTAGHCADGARSVDVYLGAHDLDVVESTRIHITSTNIKRHENYNENDISNDIGIIRLPSAVTLNSNVNVIALPSSSASTYEGRSARVSGWGLTRGNGNTSPVLMEVNSTVISNTQCNNIYGIVKSSEVCISGTGGVGSCNGDSGGPLVADNILLGIVSFGVKGCTAGYPSAFTRVSSFLPWIQTNSDVRT